MTSDSVSKPLLVVDLDDTLVKTDLLYEGFLQFIKFSPFRLPRLALASLKGRAHMKGYLSRHVQLNPATLPYNPEVIERIKKAKTEGRKVVLASASPNAFVELVAQHLNLFDAWHGSDSVNLKGRKKLELLDRLYGKSNLSYVGDSTSDLPIWAEVDSGVAISSSRSLKNRLAAVNSSVEWVDQEKPSLKLILRQLRWHQWSKNLLIFVPMIMSHQYKDLPTWIACCVAFIAFSLLASSVYILNDLFDLEADRLHKTKSRRPFASGALPIKYAFILMPFLLGMSLFAVSFLPTPFALLLGLYLVLNLGYSFKLKKVHSLDIVLLASMYTLRILAGGFATGLHVTEWLLSFATFFFFGLAIVKRFTECIKESAETVKSGRSYVPEDQNILLVLGVASSLLSCLILALYFNNPQISSLYSHPSRLWLILPILLYWITRLWILTRRGDIDADPVSFALRDRASYLCGGLTLLVLMWSI